MSIDKRLGADPLAWLAPAPQADSLADEAKPAAKFNPLEQASLNLEDKQKKAKLEGSLSKTETCERLKALLAAFESGELILGPQQGLRLGIGEEIECELKVSAKKDQVKLSLELGWRLT